MGYPFSKINTMRPGIFARRHVILQCIAKLSKPRLQELKVVLHSARTERGIPVLSQGVVDLIVTNVNKAVVWLRIASLAEASAIPHFVHALIVIRDRFGKRVCHGDLTY